MRLLVLGATGLVGSHVLEQALRIVQREHHDVGHDRHGVRDLAKRASLSASSRLLGQEEKRG